MRGDEGSGSILANVIASEQVDSLPEWRGTSRYEVIRCLGRGGMGVVYEAFDRERRRRVALKTVLYFSPAALYQFKQEFRTLADVTHRNLVRLYELVAADSGEVFFTMEIVDGRDFRAHTRVAEPGSGSADPITRIEPIAIPDNLVSRTVLVGESKAAAPGLDPAGAKKRTPADLDRLRPALRQLVEGVHAIHVAGKLHRDIKPSNVLVTDEGRVVILDFGVATELVAQMDDLPMSSEQVGTATYMAPEQAVEEAPTPASDWYSVGVMLYEALVGSPPFVGSVTDVLHNKLTLDAPPPSASVEGIPADLELLCSALLRREPERRPTAAEILRLLGGNASVRPATASGLRTVGDVSLIGREPHLESLRQAFETARSGRAVTVRMFGASGMGKSAVAAHFVDELAAGGEAVVLRGRVYERELVPYKGVDGAVDALSRYLKRLEENEELFELPRHTWALARLFPVLRRVDAVAELPDESRGDPMRTRNRAFTALRELLTEMVHRRPVVVYLDDVQWGDLDSASLVLELMRPPLAPPILLLMTYRDGEQKASAFLTELVRRWPVDADVVELPVGPLSAEDVERLALERLGSRTDSSHRVAAAIARESGGSPFLAEELACSAGAVRIASSKEAAVANAAISLERMVTERMGRIDQSARRVLELVAVSGRPLAAEILAQASGVEGGMEEIVGLLRERRFVHAGLRDGQDVVETSHDRIRETIVAQLPSETMRAHHRSLAQALESAAQPDTEALVVHLLGAGDAQRAGSFALQAADHAVEKLAFDRAENLLRLALDTLPTESPQARGVLRRLAAVLEWAGRSGDAGRIYLEAAQGAPALERSELESAAAMQLLFSGRVDEGGRVLPRSLATLGMRAPASPLGALFWFIVYRLWLRVVGLRFVERGADDVRGADRARVEALYTASFGMTFINVIVGMCMQAKHLLMALRHGDRFQLMRAVTLEAAHYAPAGGPIGKREAALDRLAQELAERCGGSDGRSFVQAVRGVRLFLHGRWREAHELLEGAYENLPQHRAGWHSNANIYDLYSLANMGQYGRLATHLPAVLSEAEQRGDLFTAVALRVGPRVALMLACDEPEKARRSIREAMAQWSQEGFLLQHWRAMYWEVEIDLYTGDPVRARERLARDARALDKSLLLKVQYIRGTTFFLRARCALAAVGKTPSATRALLEESRDMVRRLEREPIAWMRALGAMAGAALAEVEGDRKTALERLRTAIDAARGADMIAHASAARHRLGTLLGADQGRALVEQAETDLRAQGVRDPLRFVSMLMPGPEPY